MEFSIFSMNWVDDNRHWPILNLKTVIQQWMIFVAKLYITQIFFTHLCMCVSNYVQDCHQVSWDVPV